MNEVLTTMLLLLAAHFVCDYPLQGDFLARAKSMGPARTWHLFGHAVIHGGAVCLVTQNVWIGLAELAAHYVIDRQDLTRRGHFEIDQAWHVLSKILWLAMLYGWLK